MIIEFNSHTIYMPTDSELDSLSYCV